MSFVLDNSVALAWCFEDEHTPAVIGVLDRLTETGDIYVIEVNANCYLEKSGEFAVAAEAAGIGYDDLINRIAELALKRFENDR